MAPSNRGFFPIKCFNDIVKSFLLWKVLYHKMRRQKNIKKLSENSCKDNEGVLLYIYEQGARHIISRRSFEN